VYENTLQYEFIAGVPVFEQDADHGLLVHLPLLLFLLNLHSIFLICGFDEKVNTVFEKD
jgi:hypothetical protein